MLRGIQNASKSWLGKGVLAVVMGLLVVSFAIWGIGDIFRGFGMSTVAKIGSTEVTVEQFRQYYTDRLQQFGRQLGRPVTPDQARALGLDQRIMGQLVAETTLDERARELKLGLTDAEIARQITQDKNFAGPTGQFDRLRFDQLLRSASYTESRYVSEQRRLAVRRELVDSITAAIKPPAAALAAMARFQGEQRSIEYIVLGPAQAGDVAAPTAEALAQYFEQRKTLFRAPEYRKVTLVLLSPAELARWEDVPNDEARKQYEAQRDTYGTPEKRQLRQIVFTNAEEAAAAADKIKGGTTFAALAAERKLSESDIDLGSVAKSDIVDPAVADAAFALKEGEVSAPVQGRFGTALVQVVKIEPAQMKPFEEVATQIKREIALNRARGTIIDMHNKIEDERAAGGTLAEVAQKVGLPVKNIEAVDRSGRAPDGTQIAGLPAGVDVISSAFSAEVGVEHDPLQLQGGGYVWYEVVGVTPSQERKLEEIKDQVERRWRDDEIATRVKAKADDLLEKLKNNGNLAELASAAGSKVATATGLQRNRPSTDVPAKVVDAVFRTAKDQSAVAEGASATERFVYRVTEIVEPQFDANADLSKRMAESLRSAYSDALLTEYVARLESEYGVRINQTTFNQVVGGGNTAN